jgi:hypothetical protein
LKAYNTDIACVLQIALTPYPRSSIVEVNNKWRLASLHELLTASPHLAYYKRQKNVSENPANGTLKFNRSQSHYDSPDGALA